MVCKVLRTKTINGGDRLFYDGTTWAIIPAGGGGGGLVEINGTDLLLFPTLMKMVSRMSQCLLLILLPMATCLRKHGKSSSFQWC